MTKSRKRNRLRIAICTHVFNAVDFDVYLNHLYCMGKWGRSYDLVLIGKRGLDAATARNGIIERCLQEKCTHALFMDGDHLFPVETLKLLLESKDEAMISGLVCKKGELFQQVGWVVKDSKYLALNLPIDGRIYDVGVCAFGCTLINLEKLQKLKKPYFRDTYIPDTQTNLRSDVNLCNMFRDIGEKVWIDTRVLIGHHGIVSTVYPQNAELFEKLKVLEFENVKLKEGQIGSYFAP